MAVTKGDIKRDLKDIRCYYRSKSSLDYVARTVGPNVVREKVERYNAILRGADAQLYEFYAALYVSGNSYDVAAEQMGFSVGYLFKLNNKLICYLYSKFKKKLGE